jgi:SAM-dependent methyltransferase
VPRTESTSRKRLGAWYTPADLVDLVVDRTVTPEWLADRGARRRGGALRVLDPACGDGRFLAAVARRIDDLDRAAGLGSNRRVSLTGVDVDPTAVDEACRALPDARIVHADALDYDWGNGGFDLVIGNPPFLSQMATSTTRGGSSRHGGGPYADAAAEFLALAARLTHHDAGRLAFVLPQSILASRDAATVREQVGRTSTMIWSWWAPQRAFVADVFVCALGFERTGPLTAPVAGPVAGPVAPPPSWAHVVAGALGIPEVPAVVGNGTLGDRNLLNANFRDEYYGMVPAVSDEADGPPLVTSGLIDPGVCHWGRRPVRFAKQRFDAPRIAIDHLDPHMQAWARRKLVPKVLVATQTSVIEAVADPEGAWLPGVPVTAITPAPGQPAALVWEVAAMLTSPVASALAWHRAAGTGLSARALRVGPALLAELPWPNGDLGPAVAALQALDLPGCASAVHRAYGIGHDEALTEWWRRSMRAGSFSPTP